jgi:hypothetical protein
MSGYLKSVPAVLRRLVAGFPPLRPGFKPRSCYVRYMVDKVALGAGFLRVLRFPLPILIPLNAWYSSSIIRGWYNRPVSGQITKWTQSHPTPRKLVYLLRHCQISRLVSLIDARFYFVKCPNISRTILLQWTWQNEVKAKQLISMMLLLDDKKFSIPHQ